MNHAEIVAEYSDTALRGVISQLTRSGDWSERLQAAKIERLRREINEKIQDQISIL